MAEVGPLRRRMIEDITIRNLSPATQQSYLYAVAKFSRHCGGRSPNRLGLENVRASRLYLIAQQRSWIATLSHRGFHQENLWAKLATGVPSENARCSHVGSAGKGPGMEGLAPTKSRKLNNKGVCHEGCHVEEYPRGPRARSGRTDRWICRARASHPPDHYRTGGVREFQLQHRELQPGMQHGLACSRLRSDSNRHLGQRVGRHRLGLSFSLLTLISTGRGNGRFTGSAAE
jgi:Phage integrase, N-terminal SAM-like domain